MNAPLVSCIVPVYNGERFVVEAIESILRQTWSSLEVILVDDGSTDRTLEVVAGFGARVRCVGQPNAGPASARNRGLREASGDYLAFLDADDLWVPQKLARQMRCLADGPELDMCTAHARLVWMAEVAHEAPAGTGANPDPVPCCLPQALLARRSVFDRVGPFDAQYAHVHDTDWFRRADRMGIRSVVLPEVLVQRRLHGANRSRRHSEASQQEYLVWIKRDLDRRRGAR